MPSISLRNICKNICHNACLDIADREFMVLLGPNGAGKTTFLNIIAGLIDYKGSVLFDGEPIDTLPTSRRNVAYVFQDLVLFPHMTVADNIAYGLRIAGEPKEAVSDRVGELLELLKIEHIAERYPRRLSGGERQRVAIARALAKSPQVLLLDEPLSSLDQQTAKYLRVELRQLQQRLGITTLYVTHDLQEAEEMADRIALILNGTVAQVGTPEEIFFYPKDRGVSDFIGAPNILDCTSCTSLNWGGVEVCCNGMSVIVPHIGDNVQRIAIFPRDVYVSDIEPPGPPVNRFHGTVSRVITGSAVAKVEVAVNGCTVMAEMPGDICNEMQLTPGQNVFLILKWRKIRAYDNYNGR